MKQTILFWMLMGTFCLYGQNVPCIVIMPQYDTLRGSATFEDIIELQIEGFLFRPNVGRPEQLLPSAIKEVYFMPDVFDTLRMLSIPRAFIDQHIDVAKMEKSQDDHYLIRSYGTGPLLTHKVYTGKDIRIIPGPKGVGTYGTWEKYLSSDFVSLNYKWKRLTDLRKERNEDLAKLLADCPALCEKLLKNKYNTVKQLPKVVQLYNQCKH